MWFRSAAILLMISGLFANFQVTSLSAQSQYSNFRPTIKATPIWQQMGTVNPYQRSAMQQPIWTNYNRIPVFNSTSCNRSNGLIAPSEILGNTIIGSVELAPSMPPGPRLANGEPIDRIDSSTSNPSQAEPGSEAPVENSNHPKLGAEDENFPNDTLSLLDNSLLDDQDSPSDSLLESDAEQSHKNQIAALNQLNAALKSEIQSLKENLKQEEEQRLTDAAAASLVESAVGDVRKEYAWKIAKLRKEADAARDELESTKNKAESDREDLLQRLKAVESQLKKAIKANSINKKNSSSTPQQESPRKLSLAELAEEKRNQRQDRESKAKLDSNAKESSNPELASLIRQSVAKLERRFQAQIEKARKSGVSDKEIEQLKVHFETQKAKATQRIRRRFKKRK